MINIDKNLSLRTFSEHDFDKLFEILSDFEVMKHTGFKKCLSENEAKEKLQEWIKQEDVWGAFNQNTLIGWFMLKVNENNIAEIGFMLNRSYWGQGITTKIALELISLGFNKLGYESIVAKVNINNVASIKVVGKLGFIETNRDDQLIYFKKERT